MTFRVPLKVTLEVTWKVTLWPEKWVKSDFFGSKSYFSVTLRVTLRGGPESHFSGRIKHAPNRGYRFVSPLPPFSRRGICRFPVPENALFLWEVPLFLQNFLYESTVFPHREIGGKRWREMVDLNSVHVWRGLNFGQDLRECRQDSQDVPTSLPRNPKIRGRARTFRPPPLRVEDPHPTRQS